MQEPEKKTLIERIGEALTKVNNGSNIGHLDVDDFFEPDDNKNGSTDSKFVKNNPVKEASKAPVKANSQLKK